ncbi:MAG: TonB-dependent receptor plug domain-containing protein, partial [Flavobacteriales bacterium]|nr:TonB-dependent receptor plug domain-containing protein [Flavobacteriales bacterium]
MKIKIGGITFFFIIIMLFPIGNQICYAQESKQSLLFVLEQIEELFEVRFSYATQDIENIEVNTPDYTNTLNFLLETLNKTTGLQFRFIDGRYITITKFEEDFIDVCGILIDAQTLFPLEGATIQIQETSQTTISNTSGNFMLQNVPKKATLQISYIGYNTIKKTSDTFQKSNPCITLKLKPEISELQDVVLQNIFAKGIQKNKDGAITLNVENFGNLPGLTEPDVLLMIQSLPGIISTDETVSNINIRGGTTDENLILWDDIRMFQNGHFFGLISAFNPYLTKNIILYKNGTNARYGESVSGVVAMHSANDIPEEISGGVQLNMINIGAFTEIPISNKLGIYVSGRRSIIDFIETPTYNQFFNRIFQNTKVTNLQNTTESGILSAQEDFSFYDINLKAIYKASNKDSFHVNFLNIDNQLSFTETFSTEITQ